MIIIEVNENEITIRKSKEKEESRWQFVFVKRQKSSIFTMKNQLHFDRVGEWAARTSVFWEKVKDRESFAHMLNFPGKTNVGLCF